MSDLNPSSAISQGGDVKSQPPEGFRMGIRSVEIGFQPRYLLDVVRTTLWSDKILYYLGVREAFLLQRVCKEGQWTYQERELFLKERMCEPGASLKWMAPYHERYALDPYLPKASKLLERRCEVLYNLAPDEVEFVYSRSDEESQIGMQILDEKAQSEVFIGHRQTWIKDNFGSDFSDGTYGPFLHGGKWVQDSEGKIFLGIHQGDCKAVWDFQDPSENYTVAFEYKGTFCLLEYEGKIIRNHEDNPVVSFKEGIFKKDGRIDKGIFSIPVINGSIAGYAMTSHPTPILIQEGTDTSNIHLISTLKKGEATFPELGLTLSGTFENQDTLERPYLSSGKKQLPHGEIREGDFSIEKARGFFEKPGTHFEEPATQIHYMKKGTRTFLEKPASPEKPKSFFKRIVHFLSQKLFSWFSRINIFAKKPEIVDAVVEETGHFSLVREKEEYSIDGFLHLEEDPYNYINSEGVHSFHDSHISDFDLYYSPKIELVEGTRTYKSHKQVRVVSGVEVQEVDSRLGSAKK